MRKGIAALILILVLGSCESEYPPKPRGYFRIDFPQKTYHAIDVPCPFGFSIPKYASVLPYNQQDSRPCWFNIVFPRFKATLHLTYSSVENNLARMTENCHELAYKHTARADAIEEFSVLMKEKSVFGTVYELQGGTASNIQFYLTDSTHHFIRGALYFNAAPNRDSLAPVLEFLRVDIEKIIDTFQWK